MNGLTTLLLSRPRWIERRVDRLELIDLTTAHRTITFTLNVKALEEIAGDKVEMLPLALFRRHAGRASTRVMDAGGTVLPHFSSRRSDKHFQNDLEARLKRLCVRYRRADLDAVKGHRASACGEITTERVLEGDADIAVEKWGCPAAGRLLRSIVATDRLDDLHAERQALARLLFDWQNNSVLMIRVEKGAPPATVVVTYDEELQRWLPPFERRFNAAGGQGRRELHAAWGERISRGGSFQDDLDALMPSAWPHRMLASASRPRVRALGRRGVIGQLWHVAWEQTSYADVARHHLEIVVPPELIVVRMRLIAEPPLPVAVENTKRVERVHVADEVGVRAHIVAPKPYVANDGSHGLPSTFLSVVVAHRDVGVWMAATALAFGSAVALGVGLWRPGQVLAHRESAVTGLLLAPTLVATLLSFRAASAIAARLTTSLRTLLATIATLAGVAAASLVVIGDADVCALRMTWSVLLGLMVLAVILLGNGAQRAWRLERLAETRERPLPDASHVRGNALLVEPHAVKTPPPDRWIESGEGDRVPWGWTEPSLNGWAKEDDRYWERVFRGPPPRGAVEALVEWRRRADREIIDRERAGDA